MIQMGTVLDVADNSGAKKIACITLLGGSSGQYARLGDVITASNNADTFCVTSAGIPIGRPHSRAVSPAHLFVASRPILALTPPGPAEGSSSLPCALAMTTRPRSA